MEKTYIWFAVKVNLLLFIITIVVGMLSGLFLWPLTLFFALTSSDLLRMIITIVWMGIVMIIPNYLAFKLIYKGSASVQNLRLVEAILYVIFIKIIMDLIYINFSEEYIQALPTILSLTISSVIAFGVFYMAGVNYQPSSANLPSSSGPISGGQNPVV